MILNFLNCYKCKKYKSETEFDANNDKCNWFRNFKDKRCKECKKLQYLIRFRYDYILSILRSNIIEC